MVQQTYTTNKVHLTEPANGEYVNQWDVPVNNNWTYIDGALGGFSPVPLTQGIVTLGPNGVGPTANYSYQNLGLVLQGSLTGDCTVVIPGGVGGFWIVENNTSGAYTVTLRNGSANQGSALVIPSGYKASVFSDGVNVFATNSIGAYQVSGGTIEGNVTIRNGLNDMRLYIGPSNSYIYGTSSFIGISNNNTSLGNLTFDVNNGNLVTSGNLTAYSDIRIKEDVRTIRNALEKLCSCRGVEYVRSDTKELGIGVIAQELQKQFPEAVKAIGVEEDRILTVAYGNLIGPVIEALKELNARVTAIEGKLK